MSAAKTHAGVGHEELEEVAREYRRIREEHRRARPGGHARRHLGARLERLSARFEHLLAEAQMDDLTRRRWLDHLRHGAAEPEEPAGAQPLLFRGRSDAGSELLLLARGNGEVEAVVDGANVERVDAAAELASTSPGLDVRVGGTVFNETFAVSDEALAALREALEHGAPLEAALAAELVADGIVGPDQAVLARGRRALGLDESPAQHVGPEPATVSISMRGQLPAHIRGDLEEMLARVEQAAARSPVRVRVSLVKDEDPALERPVVAKAQLELAGAAVRAHVAAASAPEAVDLLEERLRRNLRELRGRRRADRHREAAAARPATVERPPEERRLVRRKSYAAAPMTAEEAALELDLLDHDFHLFTDLADGSDALVYRRDDGVLGLKRLGGDGGWSDPFRIDPDPAPTLTEEQAVERLNATGERFLFFVDEETGRGALLYLRYDGHYGLVTLLARAQGL